MRHSLYCLVLLAGIVAAGEPGPWATYRGNPARTGCTDAKPVADKPGVLWVVSSQDSFIAAPVPVGDAVFASGFGAFNRPVLAVYPQKGGGKPTWARSAPYLKLASVSSPAVSGNTLVFGDGLHQDSGGVLHGLAADTGSPLWQLTLPGDLIHLEGGPTILDGKAYTGAGSAGVLCVDIDKLTLDGKDLSAADVAELQAARWKELLAKFEEAKKKDPDLAAPPNEDQLLKPAPKQVWQVGGKKWHVDAAVSVVGDRVLACSSFLEKEKVGERLLLCLDAKSGETKWSEKLVTNPWGGASVTGDTAVVTGSTVGLYYGQVKGAKGEIAAFSLADGKPKWRKDVPGGVTSCAALADGLAVVTATDGKVRAYALADGDRRWIYDAKAALFAPPCVVREVVYVGDLNGVVHAIGLKDGTPKWKIDLGTDPVVKAPGMIYGGITAHAGRLFVATCNFDGPHRNKPTAVVCIGGK